LAQRWGPPSWAFFRAPFWAIAVILGIIFKVIGEIEKPLNCKLKSICGIYGI
jgi:hypothetical protein